MYVCRYEWLPMMRAEAAPASQPIIRNETLAVDLVCAWVRWFLGANTLTPNTLEAQGLVP